jgi:hypothetical protein
MSHNKDKDEDQDDAWKQKHNPKWYRDGRIALDAYPSPKKCQARRYAIFVTVEIIERGKIRRGGDPLRDVLDEPHGDVSDGVRSSIERTSHANYVGIKLNLLRWPAQGKN